MSGRKRGTDRRVRRNSVDVDDPKAQVWRPFGDGTRRSALRWIDAWLRTAKEYDVVRKEPGEHGPLLANGIRVLEELLKLACFRTGRLEPTLDTLMKRCGLARNTVVRALARLKAHGFLRWVRRSRKMGNDGEAGPQREQTSNAYHFELGDLGRGVLERFRSCSAPGNGRQEIGATCRPSSRRRPYRSTPELQRILAALGEGVLSASS